MPKIVAPAYLEREVKENLAKAAQDAKRKADEEAEALRNSPIDPEWLSQVMRAHLWGIIIQPLAVKDTFGDSGIVKLDKEREAEEFLTTIGEVVAVGKFACAGKTASGIDLAQDPVKVGDWVLHQKMCGHALPPIAKTGQKLRVIESQNILVVITDPSIFSFF